MWLANGYKMDVRFLPADGSSLETIGMRLQSCNQPFVTAIFFHHLGYSSIFFFIREIYYGWCLRYLHSCGASFVFLFLFLHLGRAISYASYFYNPNTWFSGILLLFFLMAIAFMGFLIFYCWTTFHLDAAVVQVSKPVRNSRH